MKQIFIFAITALILVGCGSSSSDGDSTVGPSQDVELVVSETETVYPGNKVIKNSEDTLIQINHTDGIETSTIVLLQGSATIIRNP